MRTLPSTAVFSSFWGEGLAVDSAMRMMTQQRAHASHDMSDGRHPRPAEKRWIHIFPV